jgi:Tol biopolymer transport system component
MRRVKRASTLCGSLLVAISISLVSAADAAHPGRNGLIAYVDGGSIYSIYPDGSHKKKLTVSDDDTYRLSSAAYPTWSPDGKKIAFIATWTPLFSGGGEPEIHLFTMNADGSDVTDVAFSSATTDVNAGSGALSWSPDGSEIAFTRSYTAYGMPVRQVAFTKLDGYAGRDLRLTGETWDPAWSPDGRTIVFGTPYGLHAVDADGFNRRELIFMSRPARPDWSPDGTKLLFDNRYAGAATGSIFTANPDGSDLHTAYEDDSTISAYAARWAPDGTKVVLTIQSNDFTESIKYLKPDGTIQSPARTPVLGAMPDWQPCGQSVRCPVTTPCVVPRVVGLSLTRARNALRKAHCAAGTIKRPRHLALGKAVVSKQSPRPRTRLPNGGKVNLVLRRRR